MTKNQIKKLGMSTRSEINWSRKATSENHLISVQLVFDALVSYSMSHNYLCDVIVSKLIKMKIV